MTHLTARAASVVIALFATLRAGAAALEFQPIDGTPHAVSALAADSEIEAFAMATASPIAVVSIGSTGDVPVSALRYARGDEPPRAVPLVGRLVGLVAAGDGSACYAVVRMSGKKGIVRTVELLRIDLRTERVSSVATLPMTAVGLAITADGATLLVAAKDEIRTFSIPTVASGRLYRVAGENVGVSAIEGSSYAVVAQRSRVGLVDLSAPQGRDGLELKEEAAAPAPLRGLLASAGEGGPVAQGDGALAWRVRIGDLPAEPVVVPPPPPEPPPQPPPEVAPSETAAPPAQVAPAALAPEAPAPREIPGDPGTVSGLITGPAAAEVAAVVFLGPDNILREAVRVVPDASGRYSAPPLPAGSYRIVAAGKEGRVLICSPPYISIRLGSSSAVEAPAFSVLRAQ